MAVRSDPFSHPVRFYPRRRGRLAIANFKTHIAVSSLVGGGYAALGGELLDLSLPTCALAGGLCGLSGMLPDLDSDTSIPVREIVGFSAAVVPMLMLGRFEALGLSNASIALAGAAMYLFVRFGFGTFLRKSTVHRGMFHSMPAAVIAGLLAFLICHADDLLVRIFLAAAVLSGYVSHLLLDECYSIERTRSTWRLKRSFGTAMKLRGGNVASNAATYGSLILLGVLALKDATVVEAPNDEHPPGPPLTAGLPHADRTR